MNYLIGIDIGTSGTKAVLFDENGCPVSSHTEEYPLYQPRNGWAEQNAEDWAKASLYCLKAVMEKSGVKAADVKGIGLSGQMHGLVMLDRDNRPLRKSIIWCDQRTQKECDIITERTGKKRLIEITANPALTGFTASKILWVKNNEPEIFEKCRHILLPKDYVRLVLTDSYATEVSDASGMQLLDVPKRKWSGEMLEVLGIDRSMLADVFESYEISGYINKETAAYTGLAEGTPVCGGAGDQAAAAIGNGIVKEGILSDTLGTSGVVFAHTDKPLIDSKGRVHTFCHAVPGAWHIMGVTQAAGLSLRWFRDNFCGEELAQAAEQGLDVYDIMMQKIENLPAGSGKLLYLPYLMGERTPHLSSEARGVFFGLSAIHNKYDMLRAVIEGINFSQRDCYEIIKEQGIKAEEIRAGGGGSRSPVWRKMLADCLGAEITTVNSSEGGALGVAVLAGVGTGIYRSVQEACEKIIKVKTSVSPDKGNYKKYTDLYGIYKNLYSSLETNYSELDRLKI